MTGAARRIPITVRLHLLLGNWYTQIGCLVLLILPVAICGFLQSVFRAVAFSHSRVMVTTATVRQVYLWGESSNERRDGSLYNIKQIYGCRYSFKTADGIQYTGISYVDNKSIPEDTLMTVEYLSAYPRLSRLHGMRTAPYPVEAGGIIVAAIFLIVGGVFAGSGVRAGVRVLRLLRQGIITEAIVKEQHDITLSEPRSLYVYRVEFNTADGKVISAAIHRIDSTREDSRLSVLPVVYDPHHPKSVQAYPPKPSWLVGGSGISIRGLYEVDAYRIEESGAIRARHPATAILAGIIPTISLLWFLFVVGSLLLS